MPNFAHVTLAGHCGRDAEQKFTPNGKSVTKFSLAVSTGYGDKKQTSWYNVTVWGKESLTQYITRGKAILVSGEISQREYERRDGTKALSVEVNANNITFLGGKEGGDEPVSAPRSAKYVAAPTDDFDSVPF